MKRTVYRACNLCEAICGLAIEVEDDRVLSIRGDRMDPLSHGHICPKAVALQDIHSDPDRLHRPLRRTASGWEELGWEEALDLAAARLAAIRAEHGRDAVAVYLGNPTVHNYGSLLFAPRFLRALGTKSRFSATSLDQLPHHVAAYHLYGHQLLLPVPDLDRTDHLLVIGANPAASNGSLMTAPGVKDRLKAIRRRGGTVVVVDPRRSETARIADRHLFIRPGTDALFLAALLYTLLSEGLAEPGRLGSRLDGLDRLPGLFSAFPPERVAAATGVPATEVRALARTFAAAPAAVCYGRLGTSTQAMGGLCQWLIQLVNLITGNVDRPGGALFPRPAVDLLPFAGPGGPSRRTSRVRGLAAMGGELPAAVLAEEILTPGRGQIRALVTSAGNPVLSAPGGRRLEQALAGLDFMLSIDFYLNETTRHSHLILPPTGPLEHDHYDLVFHALAVRNTSRWSPPVFAPGPRTRHDWEIFLGLERRLEEGGGALRRLVAWAARGILARLGPPALLGLALRRGPYGAGLFPFGRGLTLRRLRAHPHGLDFGPLEPCLPGRLRTPSGRIDLAPAPYLADLPRLADLLDGTTDRGLVLVGRRQVRSNNSWMHNVPRLMRGRERCTLLVHPADARARGLADGARAAVSSSTGRIEVAVEVSDEVMPGVVSLPHGWGHDRPGVHLATAVRTPGASLNDLTDPGRVDPLTGTAVLSGVPVEVEALAEAPTAPSGSIDQASRAVNGSSDTPR